MVDRKEAFFYLNKALDDIIKVKEMCEDNIEHFFPTWDFSRRENIVDYVYRIKDNFEPYYNDALYFKSYVYSEEDLTPNIIFDWKIGLEEVARKFTNLLLYKPRKYRPELEPRIQKLWQSFQQNFVGYRNNFYSNYINFFWAIGEERFAN